MVGSVGGWRGGGEGGKGGGAGGGGGGVGVRAEGVWAHIGSLSSSFYTCKGGQGGGVGGGVVWGR